ncbi:uncharacterized protein LOC125262052 [Megalobrama amblycephala]|uniref:uncharacterized protein LOC125262052 n=1 Tax=Megalobrama amblycephala TaxID=75352 RepID=UPI002014518C|nr:uncharacterized protein LOC125262052 [Megalobrama amblycephala]XP_048036568.1 uncharacterized protein LOC125262052 [Megalobrama amblycephala]XP_048036569.1 uncharacterized protein LOC125262052 [Megalobrama amblycephala]
MFRWFNLLLLLLLLLCCVNYSETGSKPVSGIRGGDATLTCDLEAKDILQIDLILRSDDINVCNKTSSEGCGRVFYEKSCDVIIKNLSFSDAGKYTLRVHYKNYQQKQEEYQLHIHDEFAVKTGAELNFIFLMNNAEKLEKNSDGGWKELKNLNIKEFTSTDAGTYRVLDSNNEILITVNVTESSTGSVGELDTDDFRTNGTEQPPVDDWNLTVGLSVGIPAFVIVIVLIVIIWKCRQRRNREYREAQQREQDHPEILGNL